MPPLAETQWLVRRAVVLGDTPDMDLALIGGIYPAKRLAIHHRHYETSLATALLGRFPATIWLVGGPFLTEAAGHFVRAHPPTAPCIAEYGEDFPLFVSTCPGAERIPYLRAFAQLEWHVGYVAVATDRPALTVADVSNIPGCTLPDATLTLQSGLRYMRAAWPIDDLMNLYLINTAPERLSFDPVDVWLEIRGARGALQIIRLEVGDFVFRRTIQHGQSIGHAAERALDTSAGFDAGRALMTLVGDGLVTTIGRR